MLNRRETVLPSSSRRENLTPPNHNAKANTIGCMAGILQLFSKYQSRRRFLTFGTKQGKKKDIEEVRAPSSKSNPSGGEGHKANSPPLTPGSDHDKQGGGDAICGGSSRTFSWQVPRSPTLPAEIRLSNYSPKHSTANPPPEVLAVPSLTESENIHSATEIKRRNLLGALEKCDEDLKAIKKIIEALRPSDHRFRSSPPPLPPATTKNLTSPRNVRRCVAISRLDDFAPSPLNCSNFSNRHIAPGRMEELKPQQRRKLREEELIDLCFSRRVASYGSFRANLANVLPLWRSKAMVESVDDVCKDIAWGENREVGKIGLALHDCICGDLIEETVEEMGGCCLYSLPRQACRRSLRF